MMLNCYNNIPDCTVFLLHVLPVRIVCFEKFWFFRNNVIQFFVFQIEIKVLINFENVPAFGLMIFFKLEVSV